MENREERLKILRNAFKTLNKFMLLMFRLGLGGLMNISPRYVGRIMVLVHTGRKSGKTLYVPVNYAPVEGEIYCLSGFGSRAQWYKNIMVNRTVQVWLPDGWWAGEAEEITNSPNRVDILRAVLIATGFAAPLMENLYPHKMSDSELDALFDNYDYRLLHIKRTEKCSGPGGPNDLAWVWPAGLGALVVLWVLKRLLK